MNAPDKAIPSPFERLSSINVNDHIEKKNGLSYLSWAWAVAELLKADPDANWSYSEPAKFGDTMMVFCTVKAFGKCMTSQLPVMDHRNKAIANPDAFQVNTAMQRCLAKAIALHGLGLYIYAGEDLPEEGDKAKNKHAPVRAAVSDIQVNEEDREWLKTIAALLVDMVEAQGKVAEAYNFKEAQKLDNDQTLVLWDLLAPNSKTRSALKKEGQNRRLGEQHV